MGRRWTTSPDRASLAAQPAVRYSHPTAEPEPAMSTIAAICIVAFLAVMAVLNKVEFGRFD
jgi:hypothetical protein